MKVPVRQMMTGNPTLQRSYVLNVFSANVWKSPMLFLAAYVALQ